MLTLLLTIVINMVDGKHLLIETIANKSTKMDPEQPALATRGHVEDIGVDMCTINGVGCPSSIVSSRKK